MARLTSKRAFSSAAPNVFRLVLTGGPCSGKSSSLKSIREVLEGYAPRTCEGAKTVAPCLQLRRHVYRPMSDSLYVATQATGIECIACQKCPLYCSTEVCRASKWGSAALSVCVCAHVPHARTCATPQTHTHDTAHVRTHAHRLRVPRNRWRGEVALL